MLKNATEKVKIETQVLEPLFKIIHTIILLVIIFTYQYSVNAIDSNVEKIARKFKPNKKTPTIHFDFENCEKKK